MPKVNMNYILAALVQPRGSRYPILEDFWLKEPLRVFWNQGPEIQGTLDPPARFTSGLDGISGFRP